MMSRLPAIAATAGLALATVFTALLLSFSSTSAIRRELREANGEE